MKSERVISITAITLLAAMATQSRSVAQEQQDGEPQYKVTDLGTLGGTYSQAYFGNGWVSGTASLPSGADHATIWLQGLTFDLGTLGGLNSQTFAGPTPGGQAVGQAETSKSDPHREDYCGFGTHLICHPFLWQQGEMGSLPTLGGMNGWAHMINNHGEAIGSAENTTKDSTCPRSGPQVFQFESVIWQNGQIEQLPNFKGDPDGIASGINEDDQVVGASGECSNSWPNVDAEGVNPITGTYLLAHHALLWQKGKTTDLGNLGGATGNVALSINDEGQVVGVSDLAGDTNFHGFLWTRKTGIEDLGTLSGDINSVALGLNDKGEVIGVSMDASGNLRAFLWQNGTMTDLNTLIPSHSPLLLLTACSINAQGQIAGLAVQNTTGDVHAYVATPLLSGAGESRSAVQGVTNDNKNVAFPENLRNLLQQRRGYAQFGPWPVEQR